MRVVTSVALLNVIILYFFGAKRVFRSPGGGWTKPPHLISSLYGPVKSVSCLYFCPHAQVCRALAVHSRFSSHARVLRRAHASILRARTVLGSDRVSEFSPQLFPAAINQRGWCRMSSEVHHCLI